MQVDKENKSPKNWIKLLLKILITVVCFWYISTKIDLEASLQSLRDSRWSWLFLALVLFILSKIFSAIRLQLYFRNAGLFISHKQNLRLYWLGMFYNLFLPGAISGDAYKVILLNRKKNLSIKKGSSAVLIDRASGVLALVVILCAYGFMVLDPLNWKILLLAGTLLSLLVFYLLLKKFFRDFLPSFWPTFLWGLLLQLSQVVCIYCILLGLELSLQPEWIFIFLISAIVSILPISLGGGLGTREVVFAEGALFFHLDPSRAVIISLFFYLITLVGSLGGLYYQFHDPLREE